MPLRAFLCLTTALLLCEGVAFGQSEPASELTTIAYPVADLVIPIHANRDSEMVVTTEAELMARIQKRIAPGSWDRAGGLGSMKFETVGGYLLHVRQSPAVHAELNSYLQKLHRGQVSIEVRILSTSEKAIENRRFQWIESDGIEHALLDEMNVHHLFESALRERAAHIMQLPKITIFDGHDSEVGVFDWMTFQTGADVQIKDGTAIAVPKDEKFFVGIKSRFLPVISADRKHVTVQTEIAMRNLKSASVPIVPLSLPVPGPLDDAGKATTKEVIKTTVQKPAFSEIKMAVAAKVPDQRTIALVAGKILSEGRNETSRPVLSKIPYVSRVFRNQAYSREVHTVIILLTPRILGEPETVHVERLRAGIRADDDDQLPVMLSPGSR